MPNCGICGDRVFLNRKYLKDDDTGKVFHQKCVKTHCMECGKKVDKTTPYGLHKTSMAVFHTDCMDKPKSKSKKSRKPRNRKNPTKSCDHSELEPIDYDPEFGESVFECQKCGMTGILSKFRNNPSTFTVYFDGKQEDVQAEGQWNAIQNIIQKYRIPKKRQGYVSAVHKGSEVESAMFNPGSPGLTTKEDFLKWWTQGLTLGLIKSDGKVTKGPDTQRFLDWWAHGFTWGILTAKKPYIEKGGSILNYLARCFTLSLLDVKTGKPTVLDNPKEGGILFKSRQGNYFPMGDMKAAKKEMDKYSGGSIYVYEGNKWVQANPCSPRYRQSKRWVVSMITPQGTALKKIVELGPASDKFDVKQQLRREGIGGEILSITQLNPHYFIEGGDDGYSWRVFNDDETLCKQGNTETLEEAKARAQKHLVSLVADSIVKPNPGDLKTWEVTMIDFGAGSPRTRREIIVMGPASNEYDVRQQIRRMGLDCQITNIRQMNPSELTHAEAQSKAEWHRARGKRARVMPVAGGHDANEYGVFLDGMRQHLPKKERVKMKVQKKAKAKVTAKPAISPSPKKVEDIMSEYEIPKAPKIPKYEIIAPLSNTKVKNLYTDWHDFYDKYSVYSNGIDRIVKDLNDRISKLPPRDKQKSTLKAEIESLKGARDVVSAKNENTYMASLIASREATEKLARSRGLAELDGDEMSQFLDVFYMRISHEGPYVERNWGRSVKDVFDEALSEEIESRTGASQPSTQLESIEEMPPEHHGPEISSDELANKITGALEALLNK